MAYDERLVERIRGVLKGRRGITERKMFGGLAFMVNGNMACGPVQDRLMVRVGPEAYEQSLNRRHVTEMDFTGRPMKGYVYVLPAGLKRRDQLKGWVDKGVTFARSLPAK